MVEVAQQLHLTKRPQAEHGVVKRSDLLDGHLLTGRLMDSRAMVDQHLERSYYPSNLPDNTVSTLTDDILDIVLLADIERDLAGAAPVLCVTHAGRLLSAIERFKLQTLDESVV